ncbi:hypothetical protein GXP67_33665 [Rhodocytophaga rosea]|uniref:Uncharacterized protein n=1 Tax=Rhodocytophaga rosea TaxID=2704465 RepID=A0A6C0GV88_9BACT|nr:hypothetical protein [Rhodocytophaga rosea]QHT71252.1 hypothetical protein GXP67_33665 [Rhodocytophaga rosea]
MEILEDTILFPQGYYFTVSQVHTDKKISKEKITEINLNTFPPSFVLDDKEVIFVAYDGKAQLEHFGLKNNINIVERFDIWEHINQPFLDTEFDLAEKADTLNPLAKNGVSEEETIAIRKKIKSVMNANFFAWEWIYLGQFDYLMWAKPLTVETYAWSMEIALRNYREKK